MKRIPDRSDYETWIIDYLDGNLNEVQVRELLSFLQENPDITEEFNELEAHSLNINSVDFPDKNSLRKSLHQLSENQFEKLCVAYLENDLSSEQVDELQEIVRSDSERRRSFRLINSTKLVPPSVPYRHKKGLYRLSVMQRGFRIAVALTGIAATMLILITLFVNRPAIPQQTVNIAVADTSSEPEFIEKGIDVLEKQDKRTLPVPEKSVNAADNKPLLAEANITPLHPKDSIIKAEVPEVKKAEFRHEIALVSFSGPVALAVTTGTNTIVTDFYVTEPEEENRSVVRMIRDRLRRPEPSDKEKITAFDVADAGINGLNRLFGWDMSLEKNRDNDGTVKSVNFNSKLVKVSAPVKKSEPEE